MEKTEKKPGSKPTCGVLHLEAISEYQPDGDEYWAFARGFVNGQCEKVYIGACQAAMFRPSADRLKMLAKVVKDAAKRYGLWRLVLRGELWVCRDDVTLAKVGKMARAKENSTAWHKLRAELCGVPRREVDIKFHEREGYGERCD